jgi:hypothetical protein
VAEKLPRHVIVDEVVREPRMHYYTVPMLGSFLAIKLEFESCLFEEAFDAAVVDFQDVGARKQEQGKDIRDWEEHQEQLRLDREEAGEEWAPEAREWPVIEPAPF